MSKRVSPIELSRGGTGAAYMVYNLPQTSYLLAAEFVANIAKLVCCVCSRRNSARLAQEQAHMHGRQRPIDTLMSIQAVQ